MNSAAVKHLVVLPQSVSGPTSTPSEITVTGATLREALNDAVAQHPTLVRFLGGPDAPLPVAVVLFADGLQVTDLTASAPAEPARLRIVLPSSGG